MAKDSTVEYIKQDSGDIVRLAKGKELVIANFSDGVLEFKSKYLDDKYRSEVMTFLGGDEYGVGREDVETLAIAGQARDELKPNTPPRPKESRKFGDLTPAVVEWYYKHKPNEFNVRYGVELDENGDRKTAHVFRQEPIIDPETGSQAWGKDEMGNPYLKFNVVEKEDGIIAKRATKYTFLATEAADYGKDDEEGNE